VITLAIFGGFLWIVVLLTADLKTWETRLPVNFMAHPQAAAVVSRLRKDVFDTAPPYYESSYAGYAMSSKVLILSSLRDGGIRHVIYDFRTEGEVRRLAYNVGSLESEWIARGVPQFAIDDFEIDGHPDSVRITAKDQRGELAVDQILQPRSHE
jgi:hypothetical protein